MRSYDCYLNLIVDIYFFISRAIKLIIINNNSKKLQKTLV